MPNLTDALLTPILASSAAKPLITHYDDAVGSRIELSAATLRNWAAKTANWLVDEFDVEPGDPVCVRLPAHWQTAGVLLGAFWAGANVVADDAGARVAFVAPDASAAADEVAVVALDPLGRGLPSPPPDGAFDYLSESRLSADDFTPLTPADGTTACLAGSTVDDVLSGARARAAALGVSAGDRVLSTVDWSIPDGALDAFLAPLSVGASIVQVSNPDGLDRKREAELTTVDLLS